MNAIDALRKLHSTCSCPTGNIASGRVSKGGCRLTIRGLRAVFDCDRCSAFNNNEQKPDIIAVQDCESPEDIRWLVVEIKGVMKLKARTQANAGLKKIADHELFKVDITRARVCFAFSERDLRRTADRTRLRKPLRFGGKAVPVRVVQCGREIPQRWHKSA